MVNQYHATIEPPYRIQKRLVLNQCFKGILARLEIDPTHLTYVTLGGGELYDVIDLVCVFDVRKTQLSVISFEMNADLATRSNTCAVAEALRRMDSFSLQVVPHEIQDIHFGPMHGRQNARPFLYFLDYTDPFGIGHRDTLVSLLSSASLRAGDYLLITSCLTPRVLHQDGFMNDFTPDFRTFFGLSSSLVDRDFKVRNHVDLLVAQAIAENSRGHAPSVVTDAELISKYRYRDTRSPMGVWLYAITNATSLPTILADTPFDEYPWAMPPVIAPAETIEEIDLFTDI
jgi:hypothetical protein